MTAIAVNIDIRASKTPPPVVEGLPPLPKGHGLAVGDKISMPTKVETPHGRRTITVSGTIVLLDKTIGNVHYYGLVMLGEDRRYYVLHPHLIRKQG